MRQRQTWNLCHRHRLRRILRHPDRQLRQRAIGLTDGHSHVVTTAIATGYGDRLPVTGMKSVTDNRLTQHRPDDAGGSVPPGACKDATQPETAYAADPSQAIAVEGHRIENDLRGTLRNFGLKVGMVGMVRFEARIQELVETIPDLAVLVEPMLVVRRAL